MAPPELWDNLYEIIPNNMEQLISITQKQTDQQTKSARRTLRLQQKMVFLNLNICNPVTAFLSVYWQDTSVNTKIGKSNLTNQTKI